MSRNNSGIVPLSAETLKQMDEHIIRWAKEKAKKRGWIALPMTEIKGKQ
jgi:hypothetical protein